MRRKRIREFDMMEEMAGEMNTDKCCIAKDVEAVVTSFNQGTMLLEAVRSLCGQTISGAKYGNSAVDMMSLCVRVLKTGIFS